VKGKFNLFLTAPQHSLLCRALS